MQHLEVNCAVRPIQWPLGVKWLIHYPGKFVEGKRRCTLEYPVPGSTFEPATDRTFILMPACGGHRLQ